MVPATRPEFVGACVRASPQFRFVPFHLLPLRDPSRVESSLTDSTSSWVGALVPDEPGWRRIHLVTEETVRLLAALQVPAPLPSGADRLALIRLVLDGILEVEWNDVFRSGPVTHTLFFPGDPPAAPEGTLARLSIDALRYAGSLGITDPLPLAHRLYRYNTLPHSPHWRRRLPDAPSVARLMEANRKGRASRTRPISEEVVTAQGGTALWRVWEGLNAARPTAGAATFKLYVSPNPSAIGDAWRSVLGLLTMPCAPFSVKLGGDVPGLLRPDKLVAYFARHDDVLEAARHLRSELDGLSAQGVPFTAELCASGLLSWGLDPADAAEPPGPRRRRSWRGWVTDRLAAALASAAAAEVPVPPWRYALDRVSLEGVDLSQWTPPAWFTGGARFHVDH